MKNIIEYLKDKIYYVMGITIVIIILLIVISSCSSGATDYEDIENEMVEATKQYYETRKNKLPKKENGVVKVTVATLIDAELLDELVDPTDGTTSCSGHVEVTKIGKEYSYTPFLICKGKYEPKYLHDKVKSSKLDEVGNGVYEMDEEYIYRGKTVKNFVKFNNELWRIIKVDKDDIAHLVKWVRTEDAYNWDSAYNSERQEAVGITTNYINTDIRKTLKSYYSKNFDKDLKARMVKHDLCVGKYFVDEENYNTTGEVISKEKECSIIKENEKIGLLTVSDYTNASLDKKCINVFNRECDNYNYLSNENISTWTLNSVSNNSYDVFYINGGIDYVNAIESQSINPVIYLTDKVVITSGSGTQKNPYIIR